MYCHPIGYRLLHSKPRRKAAKMALKNTLLVKTPDKLLATWEVCCREGVAGNLKKGRENLFLWSLGMDGSISSFEARSKCVWIHSTGKAPKTVLCSMEPIMITDIQDFLCPGGVWDTSHNSNAFNQSSSNRLKWNSIYYLHIFFQRVILSERFALRRTAEWNLKDLNPIWSFLIDRRHFNGELKVCV